MVGDIGILGLNQGGLVGSIAAATDDRVSSLALWSPLSNPVDTCKTLMGADTVLVGLNQPTTEAGRGAKQGEEELVVLDADDVLDVFSVFSGNRAPALDEAIAETVDRFIEETLRDGDWRPCSGGLVDRSGASRRGQLVGGQA